LYSPRLSLHFDVTVVTWIFTLSLHDALPISSFATWNNTVADPGITYSPLNPIPANSGNVSGGVASTDSFFDGVTYQGGFDPAGSDRKSTRLNSSHGKISCAVFCLKKKKRAVI